MPILIGFPFLSGQNISSNKRVKLSGFKDDVGGSKTEGETSLGAGNKRTEQSDRPSEPPKDYIHVRARRGQATDSHSLAERVILFKPLKVDFHKFSFIR